MNFMSYIYQPILDHIYELTEKKIFCSNFIHLLLKKYSFRIDYDYCIYDNRYTKLVNFYNGTIEIISYFEDKNLENITLTYTHYFFSSTLKYYGNCYFNFED